MADQSDNAVAYEDPSLVAPSSISAAPGCPIYEISPCHNVWRGRDPKARRHRNRCCRMARLVSNLEVWSIVKAAAPSVLSERALLLDVGYRPLSIVSVRRAILLLISEKAEMLHEGEESVRSERIKLNAPSVIRLRYQVAAPYRRRAPLHRKAVFARDGSLCQYCGRRAECIDHVHPRSKGGQHEWENVVACCRSCNAAKGDTLPEHSRFKLKSAPYAPEPIAVAAALRRGIPTEWDTYIVNPLRLSA